jgi:transposase
MELVGGFTHCRTILDTPEKFLKHTVLHELAHLTNNLNRPGIPGDSSSGEDGVMNKQKRYSPEVRERAVRMVLEHQGEYDSQWAAISSIAGKIGCTTEALRRWVRQAERDVGKRPGLTVAERERLKQLERENLELKRANEILRKASAFFAQAELDRR